MPYCYLEISQLLLRQCAARPLPYMLAILPTLLQAPSLPSSSYFFLDRPRLCPPSLSRLCPPSPSFLSARDDMPGGASYAIRGLLDDLRAVRAGKMQALLSTGDVLLEGASVAPSLRLSLAS